ncbi:uncharacterized protein LOC116339351 [Contarinia nasturtii]|uniref:uncharacterized protein LOC116339351 n=1 Tax=Contarinia nasturtii TaxID=265458 RepID=UPI0012D498FB|nr:uncharacterized protein LOC116339351 [Contarinia nasturtii]
MFLKIISTNLRGSISTRNALNIASNTQSFLVTNKRLLQLTTIRCSTRQYSIGKPTSIIGKITNENENLSREEIHMLNKDSDNFGTLSSFTPQNVEEPGPLKKEPKRKPESRRKFPGKKWSQQNEILLKQVINEKGVHEAIKIFENQMLKERVLPETRIFEWLIDECLRMNIYDKAFELYEQMMSRTLRVSLSTIEKLTLAHEAARLHIQKAHTIRKIIAAQQDKPNAVIYNALIRIYIRANKSSIGIDLANEMVQCGYSYELDTLNLLLEGSAFHGNDGFVRMIELWHEIVQLNYTPNVHTLNAVLNNIHMCEIGDIQKLKETVKSICSKYEQISDEKIQNVEKQVSTDDGRPNLLKNPPTIGHLLPLEYVTTAEKRLLLLGGLSGIFTLMRIHNISPTLDTVTILLNLIPNSFVAQQKVMRLLKRHDILPNADIFNILLTQVCLRQNFNDAQEIVEMMRSFNIQMDLVTYALFAMTCKTAEEAKQFFYEAENNNIEYNSDILNAMLKNACAAQNNNYIISIIRQMQSKEIEPLDESVEMVEAYQRQIFRDMRGKRVHDKHTRNECFKLTRECKQWLRHFRLDKRTINKNRLIEPKKYSKKYEQRKSNE